MPATSSSRIRIGIVGYGNLGRGVEQALSHNPDMQLAGIYTRRAPAALDPASGAPVFGMEQLAAHPGRLDVLMLCGGSKSDLPQQTPELAARFNLVDSFDTHAHIPEHFDAVDRAARTGGTTALISAGWDPGLFSLQRVMGEALLPQGATYTFWGRGVSQGHSDAIRRVPGVTAGVQYTVPLEAALEQVRSGTRPQLSTREKHRRECYVVLAEGADAARVREAIVRMPDYFADYDTSVTFVSAEELRREHAAIPHGGFVIRSGNTSPTQQQMLEFRLQLDSNPEFTGSVLVAYARAVHRMHRQGHNGALTVLDVPPGLLSPLSPEQLRKNYL